MSYPKQAIILCGGQGTRIRDVTKDELQKTMLSINGKPVIEYLIDLYRLYGIEEIFLSVGHHKESIKKYFGDGSNLGVSIKYIEENEPMGTGGALGLARSYIRGTFILSNGDDLTNVNIRDMYKVHNDKGAMLTIALTQVEDPREYGSVVVDGVGKVLDFCEKNSEVISKWINSGLYIMELDVFNFIPSGKSSMEKDSMPNMVKTGRVFGYEYLGNWIDVGNKTRYEEAVRKWK
jgi:NDP-sugar pyrophosphorylase family protein